MSRIYYHIIIAFLISIQASAQWYWEYPLPQANNLNDVSFIEGFESRGFAVGDKGSILTNGILPEDSAWVLMDSIVNVNLYDISLRDSTRGLIVGNHGTILNMKMNLDSSYSWNKMVSNTFYALRSVTWVNDNKAFAVGSDGVILKYEENVWLPVNSGSQYSLNSVCFATEDIGIAAGFTGSILRTEDGGEHWNLFIPDSALVFNDIHFPSQNTGYIVGNKGIIVKTEDGGLSWDKISVDTIIFNFNTVRFFNDTIGYIAGDNGQVLYTRDGGKIWIKNLPFVNMRINSMYHENINSSIGEILVCGENGIMLESEKWGKWDNITSGSFYNLTKLILYNDTTRLAFGGYPYTNTPFVLRYHDNVKSNNTKSPGWEPDTSNFKKLKHYVTDVYFRKGDTLGFMTGNNGGFYLLHRDDSCTKINAGTNKSLYAVSAYYENDTAVVYAAGALGTIVKITKVGQHHETLQTGTANNLFGIEMPGPGKDGYAVGEHGTLLRIRNAGNTISKIPTGISSSFYDIELRSDTKGFMVGAYGIIAKFEIINDQFVFDIITSGVATPLVDIYFQNDTTGYIVGDNGVILKSFDGGESWQKLYSPTNNHLKSIAFENDSVGFLSGYGSTILKSVNYGGGVIPTPNVNETKNSLFAFSLFPNPSVNEVSLNYTLSNKSYVKITIFDLSGRMVEQVVNETQNTGKQTISHQISHLDKGIYLVNLQVNQQVSAKKMVILH